MPMDAFDTLTAKLQILEVNLMMINGNRFEGFQDCSKESQDTYLWGCYTLARECSALVLSK